MKLKAIATLGALALLLQACATPHVVQTKKNYRQRADLQSNQERNC